MEEYRKDFFEIIRDNSIFNKKIHIENLWNKMSEEDKNSIKKEIENLPLDIRKIISLKLKIISEDLYNFIIENSVVPIKMSVDGKWFSAKEIRDLCIIDLRMIPKVIMEIFSLNEIEKNIFLKEIEKTDIIFYNSIIKSINKIEDYTKKTYENTIDDRKENKKNVQKTPLSYMFNYVEKKSEILSFFYKKLIEKGLTIEQANKLIEIESNIIGPEIFKNET